MMSPRPPSPLFLLGGRPYLSVECCHTHTHTLCPCHACVWGVQPRSERPALPRRAARIRGGPSCDSKMKALLSKQYRTTRVDPLHSYSTRIMWVNESSVCATITEEAEKRRQRKSATSQPAAGSHGSLFLSTSLNFDTVIILSLRARCEPGGGRSLPRRAPGDSTVSVRPVHVRPGRSGARPSCCPLAA